MSTTPNAGQTDFTVRTPADGLRHGMVDMPTFDGTIKAYYAVPADKQNAPVLLVLQEIFGVNDHVQDICRRFAHEGYFAVAVELYQRQGDPRGQEGDIQGIIRDIVSKVSDEQVLSDLDAAVKWAATEGADASRVGVTGFCWGGRLTWMYAEHNPNCKAGVAWYGKLAVGHGPLQKRNPVDVASSLKCPVLGLYGAQDSSIPLDDVEQMREALKRGNQAAQESQIHVYPESGHAFFADYRPSYNPEDARDAWGKALEWFRTRLS